MNDMGKIVEWVNEINRNIKRLEEEISKVRDAILNIEYNSDLFLKIRKFGFRLDKMSKRILRLEVDDNGGSG